MRKGNNITILYKILTLFFSKHTIVSINEIFYYYVRYLRDILLLCPLISYNILYCK